jgi:membrane protease YdiL (CAAX protease family)
MAVIVEAVLVGMLALLVGTIPRNLLVGANLAWGTAVPWAVPLIALYAWLFWRYLGGAGPPRGTSDWRRERLRAGPLPGRVWAWALAAGGLGIVALVFGLRLANRVVLLPEQTAPDPSVPRTTMLALLLISAPVAGVVEESSFRGYMQGPIERRYGIVTAILITGTMFAVAHLDFTPILWPYYVAVSALYGAITHLTGSIRPAIVLHTAGNVYSNLDLWLHGRAEWQTGSGGGLISRTGVDPSFLLLAAGLLASTALAIGAGRMLARAARASPRPSS